MKFLSTHPLGLMVSQLVDQYSEPPLSSLPGEQGACSIGFLDSVGPELSLWPVRLVHLPLSKCDLKTGYSLSKH